MGEFNLLPLLLMGSCSWESADLETLPDWTIIVKTQKNQQVSDWTKVSVMMRTSVTLKKATHFESPSFLFIDLKRFLLLFIVHLFQNSNKLAVWDYPAS